MGSMYLEEIVAGWRNMSKILIFSRTDDGILKNEAASSHGSAVDGISTMILPPTKQLQNEYYVTTNEFERGYY
jgi:hypothetical protein